MGKPINLIAPPKLEVIEPRRQRPRPKKKAHPKTTGLSVKVKVEGPAKQAHAALSRLGLRGSGR